MNLCAIIPAAGRSGRMGANKLLLPYGNATILEHVVSTVCSAGIEQVIVVTGRDHDRAESLLAGYPVSVRFNPAFATGMASSIRCGIAAAPPDAAGYMICLGDMPAIRSETIQRLANTFTASAEEPIVLPAFDGRRGHPVVFHRRFRPALLQLQGDTGARSILAAHPDAIHEVAVSDPGILQDIDTRAAYEHLLTSLTRVGRAVSSDEF